MIGEKKKRGFQFIKYFFAFLFGIVICIAAIYFYETKFTSNGTSNGVCYTSCQNKVTVTDKGINAAVDKAYDAVLLVENYKNYKLTSTGTGFIYKVDEKNGYILTNYHVINGNSKINVVLSDDTSVEAEYLGGDEYLDIAILSIPKNKVKNVVEFGKSANTKLGDTVFTIGTPVNSEYRGTVTRGILSGKDRMISVSISGNKEDYVMKVLQTDAAVNPGNSGGPLLNSNGEVIGMISLKLVKSEVEGMGFALTIEDIENYLDIFEKGKKVNRPYLGISMLNVKDAYYLKNLGINLDNSIENGVVVTDVLDDSSVDNKLKKGDVITKIDNATTNTIAYLRYELYKHQVGDGVTITYLRDNKISSVKVILKGDDK